MNPYLNETEKKLVEALRSGKYQQTVHYLRTNYGYCCLGVACEIVGVTWFFDPDRAAYRAINKNYGSAQTLPQPIRDELDWSTIDGETEIKDREGLAVCLTMLNDIGFTFNQIADVIEAGLVLRERTVS